MRMVIYCLNARRNFKGSYKEQRAFVVLETSFFFEL